MCVRFREFHLNFPTGFNSVHNERHKLLRTWLNPYPPSFPKPTIGKQMNLQTMLSMRHVAPFREEAQTELQILSDTSDTLERW